MTLPRPNDSNCYSLPLGRMGTREARHGQEGGLRRTDRGARKRIVVETVGPERDHEQRSEHLARFFRIFR